MVLRWHDYLLETLVRAVAGGKVTSKPYISCPLVSFPSRTWAKHTIRRGGDPIPECFLAPGNR
jgi:hypothetical protein